MRHGEIKRKLDEIVDFAGVERYIDTPVKIFFWYVCSTCLCRCSTLGA